MNKDEVIAILNSPKYVGERKFRLYILDHISDLLGSKNELQVRGPNDEVLTLACHSFDGDTDWVKDVIMVFGFKEHPDEYWKIGGWFNGSDIEWASHSELKAVKPVIVPMVQYQEI